MEKITLTAVGDICLGDSPKCLGFGVKSQLLGGLKSNLFEGVRQKLSGDIVFGNLECVLSEKGLKSHDFHSEQLRGHPSFAPLLRQAGFDVLNIANNHIMQHGEPAFVETIKLLGLNGIELVGQPGKGSFSQSLILEKKGQVIGFLGYSFERDKYVHSDRIFYANTSNKKDILADIHRIKNSVDWLVLSLHWGVEFMDYPSPVMIDMAKEFVDAGVDVILGHHPHVVQPVVRYKNSIICYSLGNFVFDMVWNDEYQLGVIVKIFLQIGCAPETQIIPVKLNNLYSPTLSTEKQQEVFHLKMSRAKKKIDQLNSIDIENSNMLYYNDCLKKRKSDMWSSNLFFLKTLCFKTPLRLIPGKLRYFISKFYPA